MAGPGGEVEGGLRQGGYDDRDFSSTFSLDLVRKDNDLAVRLASSLGLAVSVGSAALDLHARAVTAGRGAEESISVLRLLETEFDQR